MSLKKYTNNAKEEIHNSYQKPDFELKYFKTSHMYDILNHFIGKYCFSYKMRGEPALCCFPFPKYGWFFLMGQIFLEYAKKSLGEI